LTRGITRARLLLSLAWLAAKSRRLSRERLDPVGQSILVSCEPAARVCRIGSRVLLQPFGLAGDPPLLLRNLLCLTLKVRSLTLPCVGPATPHLLFEATELFGRTFAASRSGLRIVALHLAGRLAHLLGSTADARAARLTAWRRTALRLTGLRLTTRWLGALSLLPLLLLRLVLRR
jgi:hypothetical protein